MNLNELITKCKNKIAYEEREMQNGHLSFDHVRIINNMQEILSDLEQLKEKIENKDDYTFGLYYKKEIIGE